MRPRAMPRLDAEATLRVEGGRRVRVFVIDFDDVTKSSKVVHLDGPTPGYREVVDVADLTQRPIRP